MGASFQSLVPEKYFNVSYSTVNRMRAIMVDKLVGKDYTTMYMSLSLIAFEKVIRKVESMIEEKPDEVTLGIYAFINHHDCDGEFNWNECGNISKALFKVRDILEAEGDEDADLFRDLGELFENAYKKEGIVVIY